MPITPEISAKLLELKAQSSLGYEQIGQEVGTSSANVRRYISGITKTPDRKLLFEIVRTIGGDPEELFAPKPTPSQPNPAGMDYALYDRMVANLEAQHLKQEQAYKENIAELRASMEQALASKDEWIKSLRSERDQALAQVKEEKLRFRTLRIVSIILGLLVLFFILAYIVPDILRSDFGYFRY